MKKVMFSIALGAAIALSATVVAQAGEGKKGGNGPFAKMDADKDGSVTYEEYKAVKGERITDEAKLEKGFKKADADSDGKLTEEELKAAMAKGGGKKGGGKKGGGNKEADGGSEE